jgi:hypothetical protein
LAVEAPVQMAMEIYQQQFKPIQQQEFLLFFIQEMELIQEEQ